MARCRWIYRVEQWFDGEAAEPESIERHVETCAVCRAHLDQLRAMRTGVAAVNAREEIRDAQLPAFVAGIQERLTPPSRRHARLWALVSLSAAALIVALATFFVVTNGLGKVDATVVESCSSDIQGATVTSYSSDNGVTTVWITVSEDDVW